MYVNLWTYIYLHIYIYVYIYIYIDIRFTFTYIYIHLNLHTFTYIFIRLQLHLQITFTCIWHTFTYMFIPLYEKQVSNKLFVGTWAPAPMALPGLLKLESYAFRVETFYTVSFCKIAISNKLRNIQRNSKGLWVIKEYRKLIGKNINCKNRSKKLKIELPGPHGAQWVPPMGPHMVPPMGHPGASILIFWDFFYNLSILRFFFDFLRFFQIVVL